MSARVETYLAFRRALGYKLRIEGQMLQSFARYADRSGHRRDDVVGERLGHVLKMADDAARTAAGLVGTLVRAVHLSLVRIHVRAGAVPGLAVPTPDLLVRKRSGDA